MMEPFKPLYLFADSQLLFWRPQGALFLLSLRNLLRNPSPKAAYLGASNGDNPTYYELFKSAMANIGVTGCRMISAALPKDEESFIEQADLILLAGGDVAKGWKTFERNGIKDLIIRRYAEGALLIGVSAGAVQLGMLGCAEADAQYEHPFRTFGLAPYVIGAHDEKNDWSTLKRMLPITEMKVNGIGIPTGGGMVYHPDHTIEPIRYALHEFLVESDGIAHNLISPVEDEG